MERSNIKSIIYVQITSSLTIDLCDIWWMNKIFFYLIDHDFSHKMMSLMYE